MIQNKLKNIKKKKQKKPINKIYSLKVINQNSSKYKISLINLIKNNNNLIKVIIPKTILTIHNSQNQTKESIKYYKKASKLFKDFLLFQNLKSFNF